MTYVELDVEDELFEKLQELADEEGISVEELIVETLKDEVAYIEDDIDDDDDDDSVHLNETFEI